MRLRSSIAFSRGITPPARALSVAGIWPVADEAMTARRRPAGAKGRSLLRLRPSFLVFLLAALGSAIPALAAEGGSRFGSQALFIAELALLLLVGRLMGEAAQ